MTNYETPDFENNGEMIGQGRFLAPNPTF